MTQIAMSGGKVVLRAEGVGSGQGCCCEGDCECQFPFPAGVTPTVTGTLTLPDVAGDCPGGEYNFTGTFVYMAPVNFSYEACCDIELDGGITVSVLVVLLCQGGAFKSYSVFSSYSCFGNSPQCLVCDGQAVGAGPGTNDLDYVHQTVEVDGVCKPAANEQVTFNLPCDITITYTITV